MINHNIDGNNNMINLCRSAALLLCALIMSSAAQAHHSTSANFQDDKMIEIEGTVTSARLRNPHVRFTMSVVNDQGIEVEWLVETNSLSGLRRRDISTDIFAVGQNLRVAGHPGRQRDTGLWATNILIDGEREIVVDPGSVPRWSDAPEGMAGPNAVTEGDGSQPELGIFRVWSHTKASTMLFPETTNPNFDLTSYPLTDAAGEAVRAFDPVTQNPTANCSPKGMPVIMEQPYPMRFKEKDGDIIILMEEYDTVRSVQMNADEIPMNVAGSHYGHSVGRWEGRVLHVHTDHMNWGWFNQLGIPLSDDAEVDEQFKLAENGGQLDYTMVVTAPSTFTEPVTLSKRWLYVPGVEVKPYECATD
jgi:hypothetical protein